MLIYGSSHRNRAVHGDLVVIEMLPKQQWKTKSNKIKETTEGTCNDTFVSQKFTEKKRNCLIIEATKLSHILILLDFWL